MTWTIQSKIMTTMTIKNIRMLLYFQYIYMTTQLESLATGAIVKEPHEADSKDFIASNSYWMPSDLSWYTKDINRTKAIKETVNQWCVPRCTASSLCHNVNIQNSIEEWTIEIVVNDIRQRTQNQWKKNVCSGENGDYLENALKWLKKNGVPWMVKNKDTTFHIENYAFETWSLNSKSFDQVWKEITYYLTEKKPLYVAFRANRKITKEIDIAGERTSLIRKDDATYGHAVILSWVERRNWKLHKLHLVNSRNHNNRNVKGDKIISSFTIDWKLFEQLLANWIFWRRYRITYDSPNNKKESLFVDYIEGTEEEHTEAVSFVKNNMIIKWIPSSSWPLFAPNQPVTRLQMSIILYRFSKRILKQIAKLLEK